MLDRAEYRIEVWPDEYDTTFIKRLDYFLTHKMGATRENNKWGPSGSRAVSKFEYKIFGHKIIVRAENYLGILVCGPKGLVDQIAKELKGKSISANSD